MHISQGVKRQSLCVLTELSSSISTLKILKRKKVWMKGRKSFNSFSPLPASFLVLSPRYFSVINNDFSVFYSAFSFLPWKSTQSINNQLVRSKRNVRRFKRISSLFPKVKLKIFFYRFLPCNSFLLPISSFSSPSFLLHDFKIKSARFKRFPQILRSTLRSPLISRECHNARDFHKRKERKERFRECVFRKDSGGGKKRRLIESRVMNGKMMDDRRIPEWKRLHALDKASPTPGQKLIAKHSSGRMCGHNRPSLLPLLHRFQRKRLFSPFRFLP